MESVIKCPYCGGELNDLPGDDAKAKCLYCKRWFAVPTKLDIQKKALYEQGKHELEMMQYEKGEATFKELTELDPDYGEAYWMELLCHYGIEYVRKPSSGEYYPTIARLTAGSIFDSKLYQQALAKTEDNDLRTAYMLEAERINDILVNYRQIAHTYSYDVFISVKQGDEYGNKTSDSEEALKLTRFLTENKLKVFNSRISLTDKVGTEYEPYIMAGIMSAKAMIVIGSKREYIESRWVRNEWIRFRRLRDSGSEKRALIPYLLDISPKEVPAEMGALQCITNANANAYEDILRAIYSVMPVESLPDVTPIPIPILVLLSKEMAEQYFTKTQKELEDYLLLDKRPMPDSATAIKAVDNVDIIINNLRKLHRSIDTSKMEKSAQELKDAFLAEYERLRMMEHKAQLELLEKQVANGLKSFETACALKETLQKINTEARNFKFVVDPERVFNQATALLKEVQGTIEELNPERIRSDAMRKALAVGKGFIAALKRDGTLLVDGKNKEVVQEAETWSDIISIAAGDSHLVGLKRDGSVVAVGEEKKGRCDVEGFKNIKYVFAIEDQTLCLDSEGRCHTAGRFPKKYLETINSWQNIVSVSMSRDHIVACDRAGKAYAVGKPKDRAINVNGLIDIRHIFAVGESTIAIREDNHIDILSDSTKQAVAQQKLLTDTDASFHFFVAQSSDAFVYLTSGRKLGFVGSLLQRSLYGKISEWTNVEEIAGNTKGMPILALRTDGTLISLKPEELPKWYNLGLPQL